MSQSQLLILSSSPTIKELYGDVFSNAEYKIIQFASAELARKQLEQLAGVEIIAMDFDHFDDHALPLEIRAHACEAELMVFASEHSYSRMQRRIANSSSVVKLRMGCEAELVVQHLQRLKQKSARQRNMRHELCPLSSSMLFKYEYAPCDIYIRLSEKKHLKICLRQDKLEKEELQKYLQREESTFYVRVQDYEIITRAINEKVIHILENSSFDPKKWAMLAQFGHQQSLEMICRLGINERTLATVETTLLAMDKLIESNTALASIYQGLSKEDYTSSHSVAVAVLLAEMATHCDQTTDRRFIESFVYSAIFHDISINDQELCLYHDTTSEGFQKLPSIKKSIILDHPVKTVELLRSVRGIPLDVDKIIEQHHERPDGCGFPRKLNHLRIGLLSSFFIVAHHFVELIIEGGVDPNHLTAVREEFSKIYHVGKFKTAMDALKAVITPYLEQSESKISA